MAIIASEKSGGTPFELCPDGPQRAVCCDIIDHGVVESSWGNKKSQKHKITIRWQSEHTMSDGLPYIVQRRFTLSLHEKAELRKYLKNWRGRDFTAQELAGFDVEKVIGANALINVAHEDKGAKGVFAEVVSIMGLPKGYKPLAIHPDYKRYKDQTPEEREAAKARAQQRREDEATQDGATDAEDESQAGPLSPEELGNEETPF